MSDKIVIWAIDSSGRGYVRVEDYKTLKAERDALKAENEALQNTKHYEAPRGFVLNPDYLVPELQAERDALLVDAERYRWLRDNVYAGVNRHNECLWAIRGLYEKDGQSFDAAIDAARGKT